MEILGRYQNFISSTCVELKILLRIIVDYLSGKSPSAWLFSASVPPVRGCAGVNRCIHSDLL
jgi:hypothetical protein